jgi:hypothetical protein
MIRDTRGRFTVTSTATVDDIGHRPGTVVIGADGIRRTVRYAMFGASAVRLVYTAGPSDGFRRGTVLTVLGPFRPFGTLTR